MKKLLFSTFLILIVLTSCISKETRDRNTNKNTDNNFELSLYTDMLKENSVVSPIYPEPVAFDDYSAQKSIRENNTVETEFIETINKFSYRFASKILQGKSQSGNINYSPISLYIPLSLVAAGADGQTRDEILALLSLEEKDNTYFSVQTGNLIRNSYRDNEVIKLKITNSLWLQNSFNFNTEFINNAADNFYASLYNVDFKNDDTAGLMRAWVSENTGGKISPQISIDKNQMLSILNTIYFKAEWMNKFLSELTEQKDFNLENGKKVKCDYMKKTDDRSYRIGDGFISSSLSFKNGGSMIFILPDKGKSINALLDKADDIALFDFYSQELEYAKVIFEIPKFSFGSSIGLKDLLVSLGMKSAFSKKADFSGITNGNIYIEDVKQQT